MADFINSFKDLFSVWDFSTPEKQIACIWTVLLIVGVISWVAIGEAFDEWIKGGK
jgi:hypothetical protein